jgi:hypothetical protein
MPGEGHGFGDVVPCCALGGEGLVGLLGSSLVPLFGWRKAHALRVVGQQRLVTGLRELIAEAEDRLEMRGWNR